MRSLSLSATRTSEWLAGLAAGCDRLVHPLVADAPQRGRHRRLIAVLLVMPFLAACAFGQTLFEGLGAATTLAAVFAVFGLFWFAALVVASTGKDRPAGGFVLAASVLPAAAIMAGAGGLASPLALMAMAFVFEAAWVRRTRTAALWGLAAGSAALLLQGWLGPLLSAGAAAGSAWHWLMPLGYTATLGLRVAELLHAARTEAADPEAARLEDVIDAVVFRFESSGDVAEASGKARQILRLAPELLLGNGLFERIHVADRVAYLCALADLREGAAWRRLELRLRLPGESAERSAGNYLPFTIEIAPMAHDGAAFVGVVRSNAELAALRVALASAAESANSLEIAKGRFLAAVSHELRTPLNAIIGFSDMLDHGMCGGLSDPRQKEYVGLIKDSGQHLLAVVNAILDVSKIESGHIRLTSNRSASATRSPCVTRCCPSRPTQRQSGSIRILARISGRSSATGAPSSRS